MSAIALEPINFYFLGRDRVWLGDGLIWVVCGSGTLATSKFGTSAAYMGDRQLFLATRANFWMSAAKICVGGLIWIVGDFLWLDGGKFSMSQLNLVYIAIQILVVGDGRRVHLGRQRMNFGLWQLNIARQGLRLVALEATIFSVWIGSDQVWLQVKRRLNMVPRSFVWVGCTFLDLGNFFWLDDSKFLDVCG